MRVVTRPLNGRFFLVFLCFEIEALDEIYLIAYGNLRTRPYNSWIRFIFLSLVFSTQPRKVPVEALKENQHPNICVGDKILALNHKLIKKTDVLKTVTDAIKISGSFITLELSKRPPTFGTSLSMMDLLNCIIQYVKK